MRELELTETTDAEIDVREAGPSLVSGPEQRLGVSALAVPEAVGRRDRACDDALQVALVDLACRMSAGADPVREHVGVAIDDHVSLPGPKVNVSAPVSNEILAKGHRTAEKQKAC